MPNFQDGPRIGGACADYLDSKHGTGYSDGVMAALSGVSAHQHREELARGGDRYAARFGQGVIERSFDPSRILGLTEEPQEATPHTAPTPKATDPAQPQQEQKAASFDAAATRKELTEMGQAYDVNEARIRSTLERVVSDGNYETLRKEFETAYGDPAALEKWAQERCQGLDENEREIVVALAKGDADLAVAIEAGHNLLKEEDSWNTDEELVYRTLEDLNSKQLEKLDGWLQEKRKDPSKGALERLLKDTLDKDELPRALETIKYTDERRVAVAIGRATDSARIAKLLESCSDEQLPKVAEAFGGMSALRTYILAKPVAIQRDLAIVALERSTEARLALGLRTGLAAIEAQPTSTGGQHSDKNLRLEEADRRAPQIKKALQNLGDKREAVLKYYKDNFGRNLEKDLEILGGENGREAVALAKDDRAMLTVIGFHDPKADPQVLAGLVAEIKSPDEARAIAKLYFDTYQSALIDLPLEGPRKDALVTFRQKLEAVAQQPTATPETVAHTPLSAARSISDLRNHLVCARELGQTLPLSWYTEAEALVAYVQSNRFGDPESDSLRDIYSRHHRPWGEDYKQIVAELAQGRQALWGQAVAA